MKCIFVNSSEVRMPKTFIQKWIRLLSLGLTKRQIDFENSQELTIVFMDLQEAKALNLQFRKKNYATDILSFSGQGENLGELVICPQVIKRQAEEHGLTFREELGYMLVHGVLHLLGYDHEKSKIEAKRMFALQDEIFDYLCRKFWK